MNRDEDEVLTLFSVEQQLLNAAVSLRSAEHRLSDGQLREEIWLILRSLKETTELATRAKRIMLHEWRLAEEKKPAA